MGSLYNIQAGVVESMNALASKFMSSTEDRENIISEAMQAAEAEGDLRSVERFDVTYNYSIFKSIIIMV